MNRQPSERIRAHQTAIRAHQPVNYRRSASDSHQSASDSTRAHQTASQPVSQSTASVSRSDSQSAGQSVSRLQPKRVPKNPTIPTKAIVTVPNQRISQSIKSICHRKLKRSHSLAFSSKVFSINQSVKSRAPYPVALRCPCMLDVLTSQSDGVQ